GESKEEFVLMTSFTPLRKDNMVSWLAARSDGENYGKLLLFKFPKDELVYGPLQIEAKIDQDSEISQQLTLWGQQGSRVTRGNLLVIPIGESLLYIEPLYIQAETGQLPELKRVLVSDGERVVMEKDLATGLRALFGKSETITAERTDKELIEDAQEYYDSILDSMKGQDWVGIGDNLDRLGEIIAKLK
ncbi:COG1615 family transporter, partial [Candidatus Woesearchaeota archaeon]|nr:COG1615 family transporter [Candidatus Woesearchaeota archaeon]